MSYEDEDLDSAIADEKPKDKKLGDIATESDVKDMLDESDAPKNAKITKGSFPDKPDGEELLTRTRELKGGQGHIKSGNAPIQADGQNNLLNRLAQTASKIPDKSEIEQQAKKASKKSKTEKATETDGELAGTEFGKAAKAAKAQQSNEANNVGKNMPAPNTKTTPAGGPGQAQSTKGAQEQADGAQSESGNKNSKDDFKPTSDTETTGQDIESKRSNDANKTADNKTNTKSEHKSDTADKQQTREKTQDADKKHESAKSDKKHSDDENKNHVQEPKNKNKSSDESDRENGYKNKDTNNKSRGEEGENAGGFEDEQSEDGSRNNDGESYGDESEEDSQSDDEQSDEKSPENENNEINDEESENDYEQDDEQSENENSANEEEIDEGDDGNEEFDDENQDDSKSDDRELDPENAEEEQTDEEFEGDIEQDNGQSEKDVTDDYALPAYDEGTDDYIDEIAQGGGYGNNPVYDDEYDSNGDEAEYDVNRETDAITNFGDSNQFAMTGGQRGNTAQGTGADSGGGTTTSAADAEGSGATGNTASALASGVAGGAGRTDIAKSLKEKGSNIKKITVEMVLKLWDQIVKQAKDVILKIKMIICFNPVQWALSKLMEFFAGIDPIAFVKKILQMAIDGVIGQILSFKELIENIFNNIAFVKESLLKVINKTQSIVKKGDNQQATT